MMDAPWIPASTPAFLRRLPPGVGRGLGVGLGLAVALASGFAVSGESFHALVFVAVFASLGLLVLAITHPRAFDALLLPNVIMLPMLPLLGNRGVNPLDVLMPIAFVTTWVLATREPLTAGNDAEVAARHRDLVRAALAYYAVALFSLALLAARGGVANALDSLSPLMRSMQAAAFFYLVSQRVRGTRDLHFVRDALLGGMVLAALINLPAMAFFGVKRAAAVLILGEASSGASLPLSFFGLPVLLAKPNELAAACVLLWALLIALPPRRPIQVAGLVLSFVLLLATQSRSGLLAWATLLGVLGLQKGRRKYLLLPVIAVALVTVMPQDLQGRLLRTLSVEQGSAEVFSSFVRLFGWQTAFEVFRQNPLFGVGYLGFRFVAHDYNSLGLYIHTVENFFLEIAVSMGIPGIVVLGLVAVACWRLGRVALRHSEPGSPAHRLGAITPAFLLAIAVGNMTGDNLMGLLNVAQFAIFFALLSRAAFLPECRRAPSGRA